MELKKKGFSIKTLILVALISVIAGVALTMRFDLVSQSTAQSFWKDSGRAKGPVISKSANFVELAKKLSPSVVNISTTQKIKERGVMPFPEFRGPFEDFFGDDFDKFFNGPQREFKRQSLGSGFIINKEGYILTNNHVIENATEIIVTFSEGKRDYKAEVIGSDQKLDIALVKIDAEDDLPVVTLGDSDALDVGEWVVAIGNPFGLGGTVTAGIVSQKGRVIGAGPYDNFLQTDASINPGNSGGPLFNLRGEVVGINTAIIAGGQGIGFATPVNMVKDVLLQLKEHGKVTRGWIGVSIQSLTPELAKSFGLKEAEGVLVSSVTPGDPAEAGGMKTGDVIVSFDGRKISDLNDLPRVVAATPPGKKADVKVIRDGKVKTLSVKVSKKKDDETMAAVETEDEKPTSDKRAGLAVQPLTPEVAKRLGVTGIEGVYVTYVKPDSPAARAGLRRGDVIKEINGTRIKGKDDYNKAINSFEKNEYVRFLIKRGPSTIYVVLKLNDR
jgi:serine protease Do